MPEILLGDGAILHAALRPRRAARPLQDGAHRLRAQHRLRRSSRVLDLVGVHEEVVLEEDEADDGEEVDEDDGEDGRQEDGAPVPRHGLHHVEQGLLAVDDVKELFGGNRIRNTRIQEREKSSELRALPGVG